jgi:hypothetical protein
MLHNRKKALVNQAPFFEAYAAMRPRRRRRGNVRLIRRRGANAFFKADRNQLQQKVGRTLIPTAGPHRSTDCSLLRTD